MKKYICCAMALLMLLLSGCGSGAKKLVVEEGSFPFTFELQRDGTMLIDVDTSAVDCAWQHEAFWGDVCSVSVSQSEEGHSLLCVTGLREGTEMLELFCVKADDQTENVMSLSVDVAVNGNCGVSLMGYSHRSLSGNGSGGVGTDYPFQWAGQQDGTVKVVIDRTDSNLWTLVESDDAIVTVDGIYFSMETLELTVTPVAAGVGTVVLQQVETEEKLYISFNISEELTAEASVSATPPAEAAANE